MNSLPFAFCDSVCAVLWGFTLDNDLCLSCHKWDTAAAENVLNRVYVHVFIGFEDNKWSYRIENEGKRMSFWEVKKLNKRYFQVEYVELMDDLEGGTESSFEEIKELARFIAPFVNTSKFSFTRYGSDDCQEFAEILPFFENVSFWDVEIHKAPVWTNEFLRAQLESGMVKYFRIYCCDQECDHQPILEEFLLTKQFKYANVDCVNSQFDLRFLEQLLAKPLAGEWSQTCADFTCGYDDLGSLHQDEQIEYVKGKIVCKRDDGVLITAVIIAKGSVNVFFEKC